MNIFDDDYKFVNPYQPPDSLPLDLTDLRYNFRSPFPQMGGQPSPEDDPAWYEKFGIVSGEEDKYNNAMGKAEKTWQDYMPKQQAQQAPGGGMQELMSMMKMAQQPQRQSKPAPDFRDLIMSGHLKTLMGG